jgi:hypothetical protein
MKTLNIMKSLKMWPTKNCFNLLKIHLHSFVESNKTQKHKTTSKEFTLLQISIELLTLQSLKYFLQVITMLFFILVINKNIIKVNNNEYVNKKFKHIIHNFHESIKSI